MIRPLSTTKFRLLAQEINPCIYKFGQLWEGINNLSSFLTHYQLRPTLGGIGHLLMAGPVLAMKGQEGPLRKSPLSVVLSTEADALPLVSIAFMSKIFGATHSNLSCADTECLISM